MRRNEKVEPLMQITMVQYPDGFWHLQAQSGQNQFITTDTRFRKAIENFEEWKAEHEH